MNQKILSLTLLLSCTGGVINAENEKPNFLFIAIDDMIVYNSMLGSVPMNLLLKIYPDSVVKALVLKRLTPNMEKF